MSKLRLSEINFNENEILVEVDVEQKKEVKQFHEDKYKGAIFPDTLETAEKCLMWIKEAEENN